jgi:hypothetical protein
MAFFLAFQKAKDSGDKQRIKWGGCFLFFEFSFFCVEDIFCWLIEKSLASGGEAVRTK